jgi:hypothetical protein
MSDRAFFTVRLMNAEGKLAEEPNCTIDFRRTDGTTVSSARHVMLPPERRFVLPAFPQERNLYCVITPSLYGIVTSRFFTPTEDKAEQEDITVLRSPDAWAPKFTSFSALPPARFSRLIQVIANSTQVDVKNGRALGRLDAAYDGLTAPAEMLAKMALLNLFAVTTDTTEPISNLNWFSFVNQIVRIDRERFVAEVDPKLFDIVQNILARMDEFKKAGFFTEPASLHYDNIPSRYTISGDLITVKVRYEQGNVQLTMGKVKSNGRDVTLLDCDMDEHCNIIEHTGDLFLHVFTGGTHPIDMHEYIVRKDPGIQLGYELLPASKDATFAAHV